MRYPMPVPMLQFWSCDHCKTAGAVDCLSDQSSLDVEPIVLKAHARASCSLCTNRPYLGQWCKKPEGRTA